MVGGKEGKPPKKAKALLRGGARISYIFTEIFGRSLQAMNPFDGLTDDDIRTAICNANGTRQSLFVPEISFDLLVRRQITRLEQPGLQCIDLVFDELQRMASQCETTELTRFPELRDRVLDVVNQLLRKCVAPTQNMIGSLIRIELAYINTNHPDFIGGSRAVAQLMDRVQTNGGPGGGHGAGGSDGGGSGGRAAARREAHMQQQHADQNNNRSSGSGNGRGGGEVPNAARSTTDGQADESGGTGIMGWFGGGKKAQASPRETVVKLPQVPETMRRPVDSPSDRERIETEIISTSFLLAFLLLSLSRHPNA